MLNTKINNDMRDVACLIVSRGLRVKILSILCLILILNGCVGIGAVTFEPVELEVKSFSISEEKNSFDDDDNSASLTKEILISTWGDPDKISEEGKCEIITYYDGHAWSGAYVQLGILPLPMLAPTEQYAENRFYFINGECVTLVKKYATPVECVGVITMFDEMVVDCIMDDIKIKDDVVKSKNAGGIKVERCY